MIAEVIEVELDHGRVIPQGGAKLPERGKAWLTFQPPAQTTSPDFVLSSPRPDGRRLARISDLPKIVFHEDPAAPLDEEDWPEECR